jgi:signal transduction histidine kinase
MVVELAHELNQPLGAIVNFANGTAARLRQSGAAPELTDAVARIAQEGMRAAEIIRRVREFVKPGGIVRQPIDLNGVLREATLLIESEACRDGIPLLLELDPTLPPVPADRIQVEQVILNLIRNALEAMRAGGGDAHELVVQTRMRPPAEVELCIRDTGIGVRPDEAEHLFKAFYPTKPAGLGMGLAISRTIVEAYGGRLWAETNPGRGMTFGFYLPTHGVTQNPDEPTSAPAARDGAVRGYRP